MGFRPWPRRASQEQPLADRVPQPTDKPTEPLPWAGALPVGGRTWRVHTLVAASGVEAHLAGPTLDAILLTLIDVWVRRMAERWWIKRQAKVKGQGQEPEKPWGRGFSGREMPSEDQ